MIGQAAEEFVGAQFGDSRLSERLVTIARAAERRPDVGFPRMMGDEASLEGAYRFVRNGRVTHKKILAPHRDRTLERCREISDVLVVHDSSNFAFQGEVANLGIVNNGSGFMGHFSLAVSPSEGREVLGVLSHQIINRKAPRRVRGGREGAEHDRWAAQALEVSDLLGSDVRHVHVMDREADDYELYDQLQSAGLDFVVRAFRPRRVVETGELLRDWLPSLQIFLERDVQISKRSKENNPATRRVHPPREVRQARLVIRAGTTSVARPRHTQRPRRLPATMRLSVVWVTEVDCADGETPVDWCLTTTLPIETPEQVAKVVDAYRSRWVVEEFFKALKTGCGFERRQLESLHTLLNMLAVLIPIACKLLQLRGMSRDQPTRPASDALNPTQLVVLRELAKRRAPLPRSPTIKDAVMSIAALGGHLKRNGPPGWQTLGLGLRDLLSAEEVWNAAKSSKIYDQ